MRKPIIKIVVGLLVTSLVVGLVTASPPQPGTEDNGLTENESATLWSRDADIYMDEEEYQQHYGDDRTAIRELANGTDITFKRPPNTAATWTRHDFEDLEAGGVNTSLHPPSAALEDGEFIRDAHATIFAIHPSTRGHLAAGETPLYIAPTGTLRGFIDYRVTIPDGSESNNTSVRWSLTKHEIEEVRLKKDDEVIARIDGDHTPLIDYQIEDDWSATLTLEADISVRVKQTTTRTLFGNQTETDADHRSETLTVSDSVDVEVYDLEAYAYYAKYPNGDSGVSIFQTRPWQGYTLTEDGETGVRGVWRFYTARDTDWDTLVKSSRSGEEEVESNAIPVYVHAYPSRIGPRAEPVGNGPEILDVWGTTRPTPVGTIGKNVNVEVVDRSYTASYGLAIRSEHIDREDIRVAGIVRGVNATIVEPGEGSERQLRESNLSVEVLEQNATQITVQVELRDNETGGPIVLEENPRLYPIGGSVRDGYITIADHRVETNLSGVAIVTLDEPGIYTARYHPGTWLSHNPAYVSDTATVRWHPLGTLDGFFAFLVEVVWQFIPFFVTFYAGCRLLLIFGPRDIFERRS